MSYKKMLKGTYPLTVAFSMISESLKVISNEALTCGRYDVYGLTEIMSFKCNSFIELINDLGHLLDKNKKIPDKSN